MNVEATYMMTTFQPLVTSSWWLVYNIPTESKRHRQCEVKELGQVMTWQSVAGSEPQFLRLSDWSLVL